MRRTGLVHCVVVMALAALASTCGGGAQPQQQARRERATLRIGFLLDNIHERWEKDRELFVARASELGAEVLVRAAEGDHARQVALADELLAAGIKALVIVPHDLEKSAEIVERAKAKGVPVVSYDRLVRNADVDLYVSFDAEKIGALQANYLLTQAPKGAYVLIGGAPTDYNAKLIREGQMRVLEPAIKKGDIRIVADPWAENWEAEAARRLTEEALARARGRVTAVLASNDVTAGGVIAALEAKGLAGKVLVSGQDAELDAVRRIVAGKIGRAHV